MSFAMEHRSQLFTQTNKNPVCLSTHTGRHSLMCVSLCDPHGLSQDIREEMKVTQTFARSLFVILRAKNRHAR